MTERKTILIAAANPSDTTQIRLGAEVRDIDEGLRLAKNRDLFKLEQIGATRVRDLLRAMQDYQPSIVHFCGHGFGEEGIVLENNEGKTQLVSVEALGDFFALFEGEVECVVLNACFSKVQAEEIVKHIPYVIGMSDEIDDKAAIEFAVGFYGALASGKDYEKAYKFGCNAIQLQGIYEEHLIPQFFKKEGYVSKDESLKQRDTQSIEVRPTLKVKETPNDLVLPPETRVALIDRIEQWNEHIEQRIKNERTRKNFAFVVAAVTEEWPKALELRLNLFLNLRKSTDVNICALFGKNANDWINTFQMELLSKFNQSSNQEYEADFNENKKRLIEELIESNTSLLFYYPLTEKLINHDYIQAIVSYWESLDLSGSKNRHVLLIVYGYEDKGGFFSSGEKRVEKWRKQLLEKLEKNQYANIVLPKLESPSKEDVNFWINNKLPDSLEQTKFEKAFEKIKADRIPHLKLKQTYIEIATDKNQKSTSQ